MICIVCNGLVLWDDSLTQTKCERCGAINCQVTDDEDGEDIEMPTGQEKT